MRSAGAATEKSAPPPGFAQSSAPLLSGSNVAGSLEDGDRDGPVSSLCRAALTSNAEMGQAAQEGEPWSAAGDHEKVFTTASAYTAISMASGCKPPMRQMCKRMLFFLHPGDTVVDLSCGYNEWLPTLADECTVNGMNPVHFRACSSEPPPTPEGQQFFDYRPWHTVTSQLLGSGDGGQLVVGLCPPWGPKGTMAEEFMEHVASLRPRVIALVAPECLLLPPGYIMIDQNLDLFKPPARLPRRMVGRGSGDRLYIFYLLLRRDTCRPFSSLDHAGQPYVCWDPDPHIRGFISRALRRAEGEEEAQPGPSPGPLPGPSPGPSPPTDRPRTPAPNPTS